MPLAGGEEAGLEAGPPSEAEVEAPVPAVEVAEVAEVPPTPQVEQAPPQVEPPPGAGGPAEPEARKPRAE